MLVRSIAVAAVMVRMGAIAQAAITFGQLDDFQSGTTMGWQQGVISPNPTTVVASGGPGGAGDAYLQNVSTGGFRSGSKQLMFNTDQWSGDYSMAGITRIDAELANFGAKPLSMRVALRGSDGSEFASTNAFALPPDKSWRAATFDLTAASLTEVTGTATLGDVLKSVAELRILSNPSPDSRGETIAATLGVDDIRALTLPGDANHDGTVNFTDLLTLAQHYGQSVTSWDMGDFNFDGKVDFSDLLLLAQDYGKSVGGAPAVIPVPEPTVATVGFVLLASAALRRRRA